MSQIRILFRSDIIVLLDKIFLLGIYKSNDNQSHYRMFLMLGLSIENIIIATVTKKLTNAFLTCLNHAFS